MTNRGQARNASADSPKSRGRRSSGRRGFSLLEVILATAIFVVAFSLVGQLLRVGISAIGTQELRTVASLRCESKMEELVARIAPLQVDPQTPFEDDPRWVYTVESTPTPVERLLQVVVTVEYLGPQPVRRRLARLLPDPALYHVGGSGSGSGSGGGTITLAEMMGLDP